LESEGDREEYRPEEDSEDESLRESNHKLVRIHLLFHPDPQASIHTGYQMKMSVKNGKVK
jgi:hypothetical protein